MVDDLGSTNGTYLNGQPIEGHRTLRPGDRLRVASRCSSFVPRPTSSASPPR